MLKKLNRSRWLPWIVVGFAMALVWIYERPDASPTGTAGAVQEAFEQQQSGDMVEVSGTVSRILADDKKGDRHQRFILALEGGLTILVAHNIDIAPRVPLERGDVVELRGQYEWNARGGVVHWTHDDPGHRRTDTGWIRHQGRVYS